MTTQQQLAKTAAAVPTAEVVASVVLDGDLSRLSPPQMLAYYKSVCESVGLNPLTKPFDFLKLSGKLVLYAKRDATDQLRKLHGVSIERVEREIVEGIYSVTAYAKDKTGRTDIAIGAVALGDLKGEARANAVMKAETKAKRRVTLSICGLGMLDETETGSIPGAQVVNYDPSTGEIHDDALPSPAKPAILEGPAFDDKPTPGQTGTVSEQQIKRFFAIARKAGWHDTDIKHALRAKFDVMHTKEMRTDPAGSGKSQYDRICEFFGKSPDQVAFEDNEEQARLAEEEQREALERSREAQDKKPPTVATKDTVPF